MLDEHRIRHGNVHTLQVCDGLAHYKMYFLIFEGLILIPQFADILQTTDASWCYCLCI
jgi:hypothetical protein